MQSWSSMGPGVLCPSAVKHSWLLWQGHMCKGLCRPLTLKAAQRLPPFCQQGAFYAWCLPSSAHAPSHEVLPGANLSAMWCRRRRKVLQHQHQNHHPLSSSRLKRSMHRSSSSSNLHSREQPTGWMCTCMTRRQHQQGMISRLVVGWQAA